MHVLTNTMTTWRAGCRAGTVVLIACLSLAALTANAADGMHSQHHKWKGSDYTRVEQNYVAPDVTLRDRYDQPVELQSLLAEHRPVVMQFIFTSCQSICPMLTSIAAQAQDELRTVDKNTRIISISIDPDHDTPQRLEAYAEQFDATGDWYFLTGHRQDITQTLQAFDATLDGGNKMNHKPHTYLRAAGATEWVRLTGLGGASGLVQEYRELLE